ncbi:MAG: 2-C-methyl-D-erythritol 2,4-cyclodiphosphate synthase [Nitrospiraceae bacterium]|nr:2-C-methyl-D-erythritol 2,4-cyclodiphosphate synthase [Nitrospiraceae bacterium]MDA8433158.1 2-C-methyl-D-erythritol 2,4-cyclodiphosphate synthase [Nitrospiraceae bacterium]
MRVGFGYDSHRLVDGRKLIIGGVEIPFRKGLGGHSDADVLCHAIADAIIGALGIGDIGTHFPDTDPKWKDAVSIELLKYIIELARMNGFKVVWIDTTIIAEQPRMSPYVQQMKDSLARTGIHQGVVNIKAKTNEGMGFIGRGEGIAAYAVCLLGKI